MTEVVVAVGSNINPDANIAAALAALHVRAPIQAVSRWYHNAPLDRPEQPDFINGACRVLTDLPPDTLKSKVLRPIEAELGRVRSEDRYAARPIDLDIALYGDTVMDSEFYERAFVAIPTAEVTDHPEVQRVAKTMNTAGLSLEGALTRILRKRYPS